VQVNGVGQCSPTRGLEISQGLFFFRQGLAFVQLLNSHASSTSDLCSVTPAAASQTPLKLFLMSPIRKSSMTSVTEIAVSFFEAIFLRQRTLKLQILTCGEGIRNVLKSSDPIIRKVLEPPAQFSL